MSLGFISFSCDLFSLRICAHSLLEVCPYAGCVRAQSNKTKLNRAKQVDFSDIFLSPCHTRKLFWFVYTTSLFRENGLWARCKTNIATLGQSMPKIDTLRFANSLSASAIDVAVIGRRFTKSSNSKCDEAFGQPNASANGRRLSI